MNYSAYRNDEGEWEYPQIYYRKHLQTSKKNLLDALENNKLLQEAIRIEPRIKQLIDEVKQQRCVYGYITSTTFYGSYKPRLVELVGVLSPHKELRTTEHYDAVYETIYMLLPCDEVDLYPDGLMPNGMYAPELQEQYGREYP